MALLPGSPAIGNGRPALAVDPMGKPLTTDQCGYAPASMADIGAFQDQGFTLTPVNGSTSQTAVVGTAFANPLAVTVTVVNNTSPFVNPVAGGTVTYTVNPATNGASATLTLTVGTTTTTGTKYCSRQMGIGNPMRLQPRAWSLRFGTSPLPSPPISWSS